MNTAIKSYFVDNKEKLTTFISMPWEKIMFYLACHIEKNATIIKCSRISIFECFRKAVLMNLNLDPSYGEVSFVPYWSSNKKTYQAELIPGYKAFIRIAHQVYNANVFSGTFTYDDMKSGYFLGYDAIEKTIKIDGTKFNSEKIKIRDKISHIWVSIQSDKKRMDHLYTKEEIEERARYSDKLKSSSVWNSSLRKTDYEEMMKKTAIKHALKLMPWPEIIKISEIDNKLPKQDITEYFPQDC